MAKIKINGTSYDTNALQQNSFHENEEWQKNITAFLREWFNESPFVYGQTSGSTGTPKKIKLLKTDMLASARITNHFFGITPQSTLLLCLSPNYIAGKMMIVRTLLAEAELITVKPSSSPLTDPCKPIDLTAMVPMQVEETLKNPTTTKHLKQSRQLIIGGAPIPPALKKTLQSLPTACFATYGMTETVSHIALQQLNGPKASPAYFALGKVHFETDQRNCLIINTPHLKQQRFVTNDIVRLTDSTHFEWLGRYDNIINSGGIKFTPESIEQQISGIIPTRFFITSQPDQRLGQKIVLVIEDTPWSPARQEQLLQHLHNILTPYETPKTILFRTPFQETDSGKVIRKLT